jgi:very-short-patch-repair endonuclease
LKRVLERKVRDLNSPPSRQFQAPSPTAYELKLQSALRAVGFPFRTGAVLWYTTHHKYTPDFLISDRLIVEVVGEIHTLPAVRAHDRIRKRALAAMGFRVLEFENEFVNNNPQLVVEKIQQAYYQVTEGEDDKGSNFPRIIKVRGNIREPSIHNIDSRVENIATKICTEISEDNLTTESVRKIISESDPILLKSQSAMDKVMLLCFGLNLKPQMLEEQRRNSKDTQKAEIASPVDFGKASRFFQSGLDIMTDLFGEGGSIGMKNLLNISAPNMLKNIVLKGGPNINPGQFEVNSKESLMSMIEGFNSNFSKSRVSVVREDIKVEICESRMNFNSKPHLAWVASLCAEE